MDWFDDFAPFSFAIRSEETHPIKIEETVKDNKITIRAELPGVDPEKDIEVTVGDGFLTIKGEVPPAASRTKKVLVNRIK